MDVDLGQLPVPDWGLVCPRCQYPLRGLPQHRCPECGLDIDITALVRTWTRLRPPRFTGQELPLPDFGLNCPDCHEPLAGATVFACPACSRAFDLESCQPAREWFLLDKEICGELPIPGVMALFATEGVPYIPVGERTMSEIWGGQSMVVTQLRLPSEFFFEALRLVRRAQIEFAEIRDAGDAGNWSCPACGEENPGHFQVCWNCQKSHAPE
jgi:predicted amidophosphoribosyltransferase